MKNRNIIRCLSIPILTLIILCFASCSISYNKISNEKRIAIEYLNSSANFLQKGQIEESVMLLESNYRYIVQADDFNITTRYIGTLLKVLNLYKVHERSLPYIIGFMNSKDYLNSDKANKRIMKFLYIETLIKNGSFDTAKACIHELLMEKEYHSKYLHTLYGYFFMLYREQGTDFKDDKFINTLLEQNADALSKMVLVKNLALYFFERSEYFKSLSLLLQYNDFVRKQDFIQETGFSYLYLGKIYLALERYDHADYCLNKAYYIYASLDDFINAWQVLQNLLDLYEIHGHDRRKNDVQERMKDDRPLYEQDLKNREKNIGIITGLLDKFGHIS